MQVHSKHQATKRSFSSKFIGYVIVLASVGYKLPQLLKILKRRSGKGVSLYMYLIELIGFLLSLSYNIRKKFPFSCYGDLFFMAIQDAAIASAIYYYGNDEVKPSGLDKNFWTAFLSIGSMFSFLLSDVVGNTGMQVVQGITIPIVCVSKIPQILNSLRNKSTGHLSFLTVSLQCAGAAARIFTTLKDTKDKIIFTGYLVTLILNSIILLQIVYYKNQKSLKTE
eukprot:TRINITY_DN6076_c0_g1_i2.p1 TRINITY_DN6076_c0_g1~~TRINITY_DN6076_c0_g1_i2.p1  ORF type:complete len:248 (-),score=54.86 TRINITY_DN6076_c0_g1_i2:48-719(-)